MSIVQRYWLAGLIGVGFGPGLVGGLLHYGGAGLAVSLGVAGAIYLVLVLAAARLLWRWLLTPGGPEEEPAPAGEAPAHETEPTPIL